MSVTTIVHLCEEKDPRIRIVEEPKHGHLMVFIGEYATIIATEHQLCDLESALARHRCRFRTEPPVPAEAATATTSESLEQLHLEEISEALTDAAQAVGIDPDGMDDLAVIRSLTRRATGAVVDSDDLFASIVDRCDVRRDQAEYDARVDAEMAAAIEPGATP